MKKLLMSSALVLSLLGCGVEKSEYNKVVAERDSLLSCLNTLEKEIDDLKNGEQRIIGLIENSLENENYINAEQNINILYSKHPESLKNSYYKKVLSSISSKLEKQKQAIEKHIQDSIKLANINNLGIWSINYFVDDFGQPTKDGYITTENPIYGKFSNTATENSRLRVRFIIANKKSVAIKLFEYDGNNPVKGYRDTYNVLVQDKDGNQYKLWANNFDSDRITFSDMTYYRDSNHSENMSYSEKMHNILLSGGNIKIKIIDSERNSTQYNFEIENADWYENAYIKLHGLDSK
jgi:hypothetical protein